MTEPRPALEAESATAPVAAPRASVVIASRDRRAEIERALASLDADPSSCAFEVVVVDDGSTDDTSEWLAERVDQRSAPVPLRYVRLPASIGPGRARNAGVSVARGEIVVFLDSDCVVLPGWLTAMLAPLGDPAVGAVGGAEVLDPAEPLSGRVAHFVLTSFLTTGGVRGRSGARIASYRPRTFSMAVRREVFDRLGGFAGLRHGEDIDLSQRIASLGLQCRFADGARVHHRRRASLGAFARQAFAMGRARSTLIRRDRAHASPAYLIPPIATLVLVAVSVVAALVPSSRPVAGGLLLAALAYGAAVGVAALCRLRHPVALVLAPVLFAVQQLGYGAGFLIGVLAPNVEER